MAEVDDTDQLDETKLSHSKEYQLDLLEFALHPWEVHEDANSCHHE